MQLEEELVQSEEESFIFSFFFSFLFFLSFIHCTGSSVFI